MTKSSKNDIICTVLLSYPVLITTGLLARWKFDVWIVIDMYILFSALALIIFINQYDR